MEPGQKPEKPWFLDAAFVVPLSIFIGYFWALSQTMGEYTYFNIPYSFISLNPTNVLARSRPFLAIIAYMLIWFVVPSLFVYFMEKNFRLVYWILVCLFGFFLFKAIKEAFNPGKTLLWSIGVGLTVFVVVIASVCMPISRARRERIRKEQPSNSLPSTQLWNYVAILLTLGAIVGGYFGFFYMGKSNAETTDTFYLVKQSGGGKEDSELVFLGTYGDYLVVVPFDRYNNEFESFMILKGDNPTTLLNGYLLQASFPVREIGTVMTLLHARYELEDLIRLDNFQG
jgi:hypothetical protein